MSCRPLHSQSGHEWHSYTINVVDRHMVMDSLVTHWGNWRWAPEMNWSHRREYVLLRKIPGWRGINLWRGSEVLGIGCVETFGVSETSGVGHGRRVWRGV